jgi:hypothetical protein
MKWNQATHWIVALILCSASYAISLAQEWLTPQEREQALKKAEELPFDENCGQVAAMANMARAKSTAELKAWKEKSGESYRAQIVYTFRFFEIHPADQNAAAAILGMIPPKKDQETDWDGFDTALCHVESDRDLTALAELGWHRPRDLARAVLVVPDRMLDYVSYASESVGDPENDYAMQMKAVCRADHVDFVKAVNKLSPEDKKWFVTRIFNPVGCHPLALPEQCMGQVASN